MKDTDTIIYESISIFLVIKEAYKERPERVRIQYMVAWMKNRRWTKEALSRFSRPFRLSLFLSEPDLSRLSDKRTERKTLRGCGRVRRIIWHGNLARIRRCCGGRWHARAFRFPQQRCCSDALHLMKCKAAHHEWDLSVLFPWFAKESMLIFNECLCF